MLKTWSVAPMPALSLRAGIVALLLLGSLAAGYWLGWDPPVVFLLFVPVALAGWWFRYEIALAVAVLATVLPALAERLADAPGLDSAGWAGVLLAGALLARVTFLERTRRREAETQAAAYAALEARCQDLEEVYRRQGRFLQIAAHEFKTPLTIILGAADLIQLQGARMSEERLRALVATLPLAGRQLRLLIDNLLDQGRLERGSLDVAQDLIDFPLLAREAVAAVAVGADAGRVSVDCADGLAEVYGDAPQLGRAVVNLVSNALKYSPPDSPVQVRVAPRGAGVALAVVDEGPGIAPAEQERIFDPYYRGPAAVAGRSTGSGLGLSIVRETVRRFGGRVEVQSALGTGSTFTIWLPASGERACPPDIAESRGT
ncbi:MAG TPA: HAMP domain-containing sensor histidine kinase [Chloroflexia bacterium]|jgi:signal transduction histidine kinase|nr:HAMP domain-containing sensor histidine kinase [Chloroflexia bacterium]